MTTNQVQAQGFRVDRKSQGEVRIAIPTMNETALAEGHYAKKQLFCRSNLIAWSHTARFRLARRLVEPYAGRRLLDYGCGDGTLLAMVRDLFPNATGADLDAGQIEDCKARLLANGEFDIRPSFLRIDELTGSHSGAYHAVLCMEVLEHCTHHSRKRVLADLRRLVAPDGIVVISVPVEIGFSLLVKQISRALAGWRRLGDYQFREKYSFAEFWKMVLARSSTCIDRPAYRGQQTDQGTNYYHGHKGFNWRALAGELQHQLRVERIIFSPVPRLRSLLNSQVWFVCRRREES